MSKLSVLQEQAYAFSGRDIELFYDLLPIEDINHSDPAAHPRFNLHGFCQS